MRVTVFPEELPDRNHVEGFAENLRKEYDRALRVLNPQALRRLVRQYLRVAHAIHLNGPYFVPDKRMAEQLVALLTEIGGGSQCQIVPVIDDEPRRQMLARGLENAVSDGEAPTELIEAYVELGVVPESVWALLEKEPRGAH